MIRKVPSIELVSVSSGPGSTGDGIPSHMEDISVGPYPPDGTLCNFNPRSGGHGRFSEYDQLQMFFTSEMEAAAAGADLLELQLNAGWTA
ncbi:hypothetical protein AXG93_2334s1110 [Marchantia polymorpha subsp. ruderalis]|uniref:Uncharacterized protein n=1 Tax=Marchantia polymorpha subsp. ruderalis TaxID=1480154 RepID=A0A176W4D3_MARPO|nr:hypothetical protein AXG93_2334s1110 [Marchantia polymorpha subsp. ruderalis]